MAKGIEYTLAGSLTALAILGAVTSHGSLKEGNRANVAEQFAYVQAGLVSPVRRDGATGNIRCPERHCTISKIALGLAR
jgi:hypothetical protein